MFANNFLGYLFETACSYSYLSVIGADVSLHRKLRIFWTILSGTVLLWQHLVACSSQTWVYWRVSFWWSLGCKEARCWQSGGQSLIPQCCTLCSSLKNLTTCCLLECGPIDVSTPLDTSTSNDDIFVEGISSGLDEVCVLHTCSLVSDRWYFSIVETMAGDNLRVC